MNLLKRLKWICCLTFPSVSQSDGGKTCIGPVFWENVGKWHLSQRPLQPQWPGVSQLSGCGVSAGGFRGLIDPDSYTLEFLFELESPEHHQMWYQLPLFDCTLRLLHFLQMEGLCNPVWNRSAICSLSVSVTLWWFVAIFQTFSLLYLLRRSVISHLSHYWNCFVVPQIIPM